MNPTQTAVRNLYMMQDELNARLNPDWVSQGWPYYRAVWTEAGEAVQHIKSWLWWKQGEFGKVPSAAQLAEVRVELIDILHFGLSMDIVEAATLKGDGQSQTFLDLRVDSFINCFNVGKEHGGLFDICEDLEFLVETVITTKTFPIVYFVRACIGADLPLSDMLALYNGKYALNQFRWNNGYNKKPSEPGAYIKYWGGKEDNTVMLEITQMLSAPMSQGDLVAAVADGSYSKAMHERFEQFYPRV